LYQNYDVMKFCLAGIVLLVLISCGKRQESIFPTEEKITSSVYASGTIKSLSQYEVYSKVGGIIDQILVKEGDQVKMGQVIYHLSSKAQELSYENAKLLANYSSENSNQEKLNQAQTDMEIAQLKVDNDLSLLERQKKLWSSDIGTKNELEQRELIFKNSLALFNASKLKLNDLKKQIAFQSKQTEKNAAITSSSMNDYVIKSDRAGKVYSLAKEKGEMISTQLPIAIIGDANKFYIELQVDEYDITKLKKGQIAIISLDSYKGQSFEARIEKIYPLMNDKTKSFKVDAVFTIQPKNLFPNLSAQANIVIEVKEKVLTIPRAYLIDNEYIYLSNNEKRKVKTGLMDYEKVEIDSGLSVKDAIVKSIR